MGSGNVGDKEGKKLPPLEKHTYRQDGLLEVNPNGPHPIFELVKNAEEEWAQKLDKASNTLQEAVAEYKRRYKRDPPFGFDHWWAYVEQNNVQLPDEYDQIYHDLEPFWGIDPVELQQIQSDWEAHEDSFTIGKEADTLIGLLNYTSPENEQARFVLAKGAFEVMELLEDVEAYIPAFRAVFSPHDNPNLHADYELKERALKAAAEGTFIDLSDPPQTKLHGWISACPPSTKAWEEPIDLDTRTPPRDKKVFVHNHRLAMDPCHHPELLKMHGQFLSHDTGPVPHQKLIPQFSWCPTMLHQDIMPAMSINWVEDIYPRNDDPEWEDKHDERLQWRGRTTGIWHGNKRWRSAHRERLVDWANKLGGNVSLLLPTAGEDDRVGESVEVRKVRVAPAVADVAFTPDAVSCSPEMCEELEKIFEFRRPHDNWMAGRYKYIIDVDGNGWSSRFKRLITSNSLIFKSTVYPEWYTDRIQPWVHYVPVHVDLTDLYDSLLFFRGDQAGKNSHDAMAKKIAYAGREWSKLFWRKEDLTAYMFRLFLEYARVMSPDRLKMSFVPTEPLEEDEDY
ncbi:glycosyl transferase family 90-domain-containing protein [Cyathus striatus]|nr:glycosyl transferase family 90-domain-containing protein [Cyathus striatus]